LDAVTVELLLGQLLDEDDLRRNENGRLTLLIRNGDLNEGALVIAFAALEAQAALGHVFASDDIVAAIGMADAGVVADFDARMLAAIDLGWPGFFRCGHGEDRGGQAASLGNDFRQFARGGVERRSGWPRGGRRHRRRRRRFGRVVRRRGGRRFRRIVRWRSGLRSRICRGSWSRRGRR